VTRPLHPLIYAAQRRLHGEQDMTDKIFNQRKKRCKAETDARDIARKEYETAEKALRAALIDAIEKELADCGISIGSPVIVHFDEWRKVPTEPGVLRGFDHQGVVVAKRKKDGAAHATHTFWGFDAITLDTEALKGGAQ